MAVQKYSVQSASDAWKLLSGLVCVHKSSDYALRELVEQLKRNLANDLNEMRRSVEFDSVNAHEKLSIRHDDSAKINDSFEINSYESDYAELSAPNYETHPLVLGKGFKPDDIDVRPVNLITRRESGLCLLTINNPATCNRLKSKKYPMTYRIHAELGKRTDTMFADGKILEKTTFSHLEKRPQRFNSLLHSIQSSHQKEAFKYLQVSLQSQEAYEIAAKGPVRPENLSDGLIYKLNCVSYSPPDITLDATCVGASAEYFASLINEIGWKLKTNAITKSVRLLRLGYFDLNSAILMKHCDLENIIQNIYHNEAILKHHGSPHKSSLERDEVHNYSRPHFEKYGENISEVD